MFTTGFAAGSAFIFPTIHLMTAAPPGDRLNFFGAMLGAGITVAGSVIAVASIERLKLRRERAERRLLLLELIADVLRVERAVKKLVDKKESLTSIATATINLNRRIKVLKDARQWIVPDNAGMVRAFGYIGTMTALPQHGGSPGPDQRRILMMDLQAKLASLRTWARAARRELLS